MSEAIRRIADHDYSIDERMIAHADVWLPGSDAPIEDWARTHAETPIAAKWWSCRFADGVETSSFGCDGVIVYTPTGPTAYAFSRAAGDVAERQRHCS